MITKTTFWRLLSEKKIEIPHYQRDYVQGWTETNGNKGTDKYENDKIKEIRQGFISKLFDSITREKNLSLNLIFGSENGSNDFFVPVDGQQRLTTLFLVHWLIALKAGQLTKHQKVFSNFIYQTRKTSNEFFNLLISISHSPSTPITKLVQTNNRFFSKHLADPTVLAVLVMIEEIERVFISIDYQKVFEYLTGDRCLLSLDVINLGSYKLSDELYIKMNSRGKPLTYFEKFKAWLPDYISDVNKNNNKPNLKLPENWSLKLDTQWLDLFWKYKDDDDYIVDQEFMRFFNGMIQLSMAAHQSLPITDDLKDKIKLFNNSKENVEKKRELELSLEQYEKMNCICDTTLCEIANVLDLLVENDKNLSEWLEDISFFKKNETKEKNKLFIEFITGQISYADRLRFYAMYKYLLAKREQISEIEFKRWIRVVRNLIENTTLNEENYIKLVRRIDKLSEKVRDQDILSFLNSLTNDDLGPFDNFQLSEEIRKSKLIIENAEWEKEISIAESHNFFKGQIYFLLEMAENDLAKFVEYREKAIVIFSENGLVDRKDFIVHRALLVKGNYLFDLSSNRKGFCKNEQQWREKIFRDSRPNTKYPKGRVGILKQLLNDISPEDPHKSLNDIIDSYELKDWRYYFIKSVWSLEVCREKLVNFSGENEIYLLNKSRMSSIHWELRSWFFYKKFFDQKRDNFLPFTKKWYFGSTSYEKPCAVLDEFRFEGETYKIDIHFNEKGVYIISLFLQNAKGDDQQLLIAMNNLAKLDMKWGDNKRLFIHCRDETEVLDRLNEICKGLRQMNGAYEMIMQ